MFVRHHGLDWPEKSSEWMRGRQRWKFEALSAASALTQELTNAEPASHTHFDLWCLEGGKVHPERLSMTPALCGRIWLTALFSAFLSWVGAARYAVASAILFPARRTSAIAANLESSSFGLSLRCGIGSTGWCCLVSRVASNEEKFQAMPPSLSPPPRLSSYFVPSSTTTCLTAESFASNSLSIS
jgi:hypothetical protein